MKQQWDNNKIIINNKYMISYDMSIHVVFIFIRKTELKWLFESIKEGRETVLERERELALEKDTHRERNGESTGTGLELGFAFD